MNQLTIMGHLGADPEVRFTSSGQKVTTLRIAENQRRGGKDETLWWRATIWGEHLDKMISYLKKGSAVIVAGEMPKPEIYNDRDGNPQISLNMTAHQVTFSPFGRSDKSDEPAMAGQSNNRGAQSQAGAGGSFGGGQQQQQESRDQMSQGQGDPAFNNASDDEIPF